MRQYLPTGTPLRERLDFASMPEPNSGCLLWLAGTWGGGYGRISVDGVERPAHVVSWEEHHGCSVPEGLDVCHKCDVRPCIEPSHLFVGTPSDNMQDMHRKGRANKPSRKGERNGRHKLTEEDVLAIRADTRNPKIIAPLYGVHWSVIYHVRDGRKWGHVK